jgi:hypothetical protein
LVKGIFFFLGLATLDLNLLADTFKVYRITETVLEKFLGIMLATGKKGEQACDLLVIRAGTLIGL